MPHAQPCRLWIVLLCGSKIKEKQSKKKRINISQAQSHASDSSLLIVHLGSLHLINGRLHCFAAGPWPSLFVQVITFQNEGGCAIWELGFFFFPWQEGWIISVFKPDYIKSISSSSVWSIAPFNVWSESVFWGHFCAVLSPLMVLSLFHLCIYHHPIYSPQRCTMHAVKQFPRAQNHCKGFTKETDESWKTCQLNFHFELKYPKGLWIFTFPAFVERLGTIWKLIFIFRRKMKLG